MDKDYRIGFDIGGTKCAVILGRCCGGEISILGKVKFATASTGGPAACLERMAEEASKLLADAGISAGNVSGCGISCGGPLDSKRGIIQSPPNLPGWDNVPAVEFLQQKTGLPCYLQNDANACAVAEYRFGAGRGTKNMIFLTFGTGLGAGLILDGKLYSGTNDNAGECGHVRLSEFGPVGYAKSGSFEGFCSGGGIAQLAALRVREAFQANQKVSWCKSADEIPGLSAKVVGDAAEKGDALAQQIYAESGDYLGRGLSILIDILNPERIVIGSVFARSESLFRKAMEERIRKEALPGAAAVCRVVPAQLGETIGDIASLSLAGGDF